MISDWFDKLWSYVLLGLSWLVIIAGAIVVVWLIRKVYKKAIPFGDKLTIVLSVIGVVFVGFLFFKAFQGLQYKSLEVHPDKFTHEQQQIRDIGN